MLVKEKMVPVIDLSGVCLAYQPNSTYLENLDNAVRLMSSFVKFIGDGLVKDENRETPDVLNNFVYSLYAGDWAETEITRFIEDMSNDIHMAIGTDHSYSEKQVNIICGLALSGIREGEERGQEYRFKKNVLETAKQVGREFAVVAKKALLVRQGAFALTHIDGIDESLTSLVSGDISDKDRSQLVNALLLGVQESLDNMEKISFISNTCSLIFNMCYQQIKDEVPRRVLYAKYRALDML